MESQRLGATSIHNEGASLNANAGTGSQQNHSQHGDGATQYIAHTINNYSTTQNPLTTTSTHPLRIIPYTQDHNFIDRPELAQLQEKLAYPGARAAIYGLGGVGKSQLAIEYCWRKQDTWIFWIHSSSAARFDQDVRTIAVDLGIIQADDKHGNVLELFRGWLNDSSRSWLVVLDSADEPGFLFERTTARSRLEHIPTHGHLLVTTRNRAVASQVADRSFHIELRPDQHHATALLCNRLEHPADDEEIAGLEAALDNIPLAIAQAAAYINRRMPRTSVQSYLAKLGKDRLSEANLLNARNERERRRDWEANDSVLLTWQISFEHIYTTHKSAADLLSLMSFYDQQGIPDFLVQDAYQDASAYSDAASQSDSESYSSTISQSFIIDGQFEDDVATLQDFSLISPSPDGYVYQMHRLVQRAAHLWLHVNERHLLWEGRSLARLRHAFPSGTYENWGICHALYPQAKLLCLSDPDDDAAKLDLSSVLFHAARYADGRGLYVDAVPLAQRSYDIRCALLGADGIDTLCSANMLGIALYHEGNIEAAEDVYRTTEMVLEANHSESPLLSAIKHNLAAHLHDQGQYHRAELLLRNVLDAETLRYGPSGKPTLISKSKLAESLQRQNKLHEAEDLLLDVLHYHQAALGEEHPLVATGKGRLADVYADQGRLTDAELLQLEALKMKTHLLGEEHRDTLVSVSDLATIYSRQGRVQEAVDLQLILLRTHQRLRGDGHPDTLTLLSNLSYLYFQQERYQEAEKLVKECLELRTKTLGVDHPKTTKIVNILRTIERGLNEESNDQRAPN